MRTAIILEIQRVAAEHNKKIPPLVDDLPLLETGLDSLCYAIVVARLEEKTGADPLSAVERFPNTLGELISLYENCERRAEPSINMS